MYASVLSISDLGPSLAMAASLDASLRRSCDAGVKSVLVRLTLTVNEGQLYHCIQGSNVTASRFSDIDEKLLPCRIE